jgi:hypothetical protein
MLRMQWFTKLGDSLGPLANILEVFGALIGGAGLAWGLSRGQVRRQQKIQESLEEALLERRREIDRLNELLTQEQQLNPANWLVDAAREEKDGNPSKAAALLLEGTDQISPALSSIYQQLAAYHIALYPSPGNPQQLVQAQRYARLSALVSDYDPKALALLDEIDGCVAMASTRDSRVPASSTDHKYLDPYYGSGGADALPLVRQLLTVFNRHFQAGQYLVAERLAYRARQVAIREISLSDENHCSARIAWANALLGNGIAARALEELDSLLPVVEQSLGKNSETAIDARVLRCEALLMLGRYDESLRDIDHLVSAIFRIFGQEGHVRFDAASVRATLLIKLGRYEEALGECESLISIRGSTLDATDSRMLKVRGKKAEALQLLGRDAQALTECDAIQSLLSETFGQQHPETFLNGFCRSKCLARLSRLDEAFREIDTLLQSQMALAGPMHVGRTIPARTLRANLLWLLGRRGESIRELEDLWPAVCSMLGETHPESIQIGLLRAEFLAEMERPDEPRGEREFKCNRQIGVLRELGMDGMTTSDGLRT